MSDTLYHGLAHAAPPPKQDYRIAERWKEWLPFATMEARKCLDPVASFALFKTRHRTRLINLLSAHVSWRAIRHHRLDDPTEPDGVFEFQLRAAVERRRVRMGRVKGIKRRNV